MLKKLGPILDVLKLIMVIPIEQDVSRQVARVERYFLQCQEQNMSVAAPKNILNLVLLE